MRWKKLFLFLLLAICAGIYVLLFHQDKNLKYIPENADVAVILDTKKAKRKYISEFLLHPSEWFKKRKKESGFISLKNSGLKMPDFIQVFHLKDSKLSEWYSVFEIDDEDDFKSFLKSRKFVSDGKYQYKNERFYIKIEGEKCIFSTSAKNFSKIGKPHYLNFENQFMSADSFIRKGLGSISFINDMRTKNFSVELNEDNIVIASEGLSENFNKTIEKLLAKTQFLEAELDNENIKKADRFFGMNFSDSVLVNKLKINAKIEQVNDTIVSYSYDDNFNEIEKVSYQKIVQPTYVIQLQSSDVPKTISFFKTKKWLNADNQFTAIPFLPNAVTISSNKIFIKSKTVIPNSENLNQNFIFVKNNPLLYSSLKMITNTDKKFLQNIDYVFFGNTHDENYFKIKFKKGNLPIILR